MTIKKISFPKGEFMVDTDSLPLRHKNFWELFLDSWEQENKESLSNFIDSETTVIDLGAWVGPVTLFCATLGAKHVYTFEPDTSAYTFLKNNIELNPNLEKNITIYNSAIAQSDGVLNIGPLSGRELGESTTSTEGDNLFSVPALSTKSLFKLCQLNSAKKLCLKIDIEGSEKYVLKEIVNELIKINIPFLLLIEIHAFHFNKQDSQEIEKSLNTLISICNSFKFKQRRRIGENIENSNWQNELYDKNGLFDMTFES